MKKNNENAGGFGDVYPDISAIFDVDGKVAAPSEEKTPDALKKNERILTSPEGLKHLPKEERKKIQKDARKKKREARVKKAKTRAIIVLSVVLVALIAGLAIWWKITDAKKPVVSVAPVTVETVERAYSGAGVILNEDGRVTAVMIDNDYDVHYIAKKLSAQIVTADKETLPGTVSDIRELRPADALFAGLTSTLLGETPEVPVYAVYITPDDAAQAPANGSRVTVRVITDTAENAVAVPSTAVLMDGNQPYVWLYHAFTKKLTRQDVAVGISSEEKTEILRGLEKGDRVVASSTVTPAELYDGIKVKQKQG